MSPELDAKRSADAVSSGRGDLTLAGAFLVGGLLLNLVSTLAHPSGDEDNHEAIFAKYADSGTWVAVHLGQFVGVSLALGGLLVLYRAMHAGGHTPLLGMVAAAATVATAAAWAVLQGLDGVALKQAVAAWDGASGNEKATRFANAETVRWLEWGFQSYFRLLLGLALVLFGAAILGSGVVAAWMGWAAVLAGLVSAAIGVDVGYSGLASGLQDTLSLAFQVVVLAFAVGVLVSGMRQSRQHATAAT
jgi:hypothetical protein